MFSAKNFSPNQLSAFTSLILSVPISIGFYFVHYNIVIAITAFIIICAGSYLLIRFVLESFIYRKLKLIYKYIYQTKANKKEEMYYKYILPKKNIDEVREYVEEWGEQKRAEIESLQNNEAYRKEFLQNLAHEFKTPIFNLQGYIDTLLNGALDNPEINKKFLENAAKNVTRMVNLVNDLDEITKLESGEQLLLKKNFIIQDVIKDVFETLSLKAAENNIHCFIKKGCEQPIQVFADVEKIAQVLVNLIDNAIKYGKAGGHVIASIYKTDTEHVLIEISDDGVGISEEHLPRIFERFYRTDHGRSRNVGGTGLGLAICKHIIEAHEQSIHVRSKINVGTTIGFTMQAKKE
ncbi:MAG: ATP-binding protein [Parafilimonas sp.]